MCGLALALIMFVEPSHLILDAKRRSLSKLLGIAVSISALLVWVRCDRNWFILIFKGERFTSSEGFYKNWPCLELALFQLICISVSLYVYYGAIADGMLSEVTHGIRSGPRVADPPHYLEIIFIVSAAVAIMLAVLLLIWGFVQKLGRFSPRA